MDDYDPSLLGVLHSRVSQGLASIRDPLPVLRPLAPGQIDPSMVLSPREMDILRLLSVGKTEREIAFRLFISVDGVGHQTRVIARKLRIRRRDLPRVPLPAA